MVKKIFFTTTICLFFAFTIHAQTTRTVTDSRGVDVLIPSEINRVVTVSDGLIEGVMTSLKVQDKIVAVGSSCIQRIFNYDYPTVKGSDYSYNDGMNPILYLNPWIKNLPLIGKSSTPLNYEALVNSNPDIVIIRVGSCTLRFVDDENSLKTVEMLESLGLPVIVLYGTNCHKIPSVSQISNEIKIIGNVFNKSKQAKQLADYLEKQINLIKKRTADIKESEKVDTLILGLSPRARKAGGAGQVFGLDTIESFFIESIVNAKNSYNESGYFKKINTEQLLALDPEVIVLCTAFGYHPPKELYEAPYYQDLKDLKAVKNKNIAALPWSPCNCSKRLEYPIDTMVIAKASYPEKFKDIDLSEWLLDFYMNVYGVGKDTASQLRSAQWMDWTLSASN